MVLFFYYDGCRMAYSFAYYVSTIFLFKLGFSRFEGFLYHYLISLSYYVNCYSTTKDVFIFTLYFLCYRIFFNICTEKSMYLAARNMIRRFFFNHFYWLGIWDYYFTNNNFFECFVREHNIIISIYLINTKRVLDLKPTMAREGEI